MNIQKEHILIGIAVLVLICVFTSKKENYDSFCGNCHDLTPEECANCPNCGVCTSDKGCKSCRRGTSAGPYFSDKCVDWEYMGETPNNKCWDYTKKSPYNCGYKFPYNKRVVNHIDWARMPKQIGTGPKA